jgi:hypothetical protein
MEKKNEVCANCAYIQRPFREDLAKMGESFYCAKQLKFVDSLYSKSCCYFKFLRDENDWL